MMHCKQMKPISSANNTQQKGQQIERILYKMDNKKNNTQQRAKNENKTQQKGQQIKTTLNKKGNKMTSKFHKVVHGFAFDKGVVNESKKQVAITFHCNLIEFSRPFLKKSCSNLVVAGFLFFY